MSDFQVVFNGLHPDVKRRIEQIHIPEELTCVICLLPYPQQHFTKAQLNAVRTAIYKEGPGILYARHIAKCQSCGGKKNFERKCRICCRWKSIDEYARVQRNLESPICMRCQDWGQQEELRKASLPLNDAPGGELKAASIASASTTGTRVSSGQRQPALLMSGQHGLEIEVMKPKSKPKSFVKVRKGGWASVPSHLSTDSEYTPDPEEPPEADEDDPLDDLDTWDYL